MLQAEFPDVTISKIRFLESQGLVRPERNASGYRQFADQDVERLRWILRQQRDHFLPLKVIKKALDRGLDVPDAGDGDQPTLWSALADEAAAEEAAEEAAERAAAEQAAEQADEQAAEATQRRAHAPRQETEASQPAALQAAGASESEPEPAGSGTTQRRHRTPADVVAALQEDPRPEERRVRRRRSIQRAAEQPPRAPLVAEDDGERLGRREFLETTGLSEETLDGLESYGLIETVVHAGEPTYDATCVRLATAAARMVALGVEPRHLRIYKVAAEREAGLIEQLVMPLVKQRNPAAREKATELAEELARFGSEIHATVLSRELGPGLSG